MSAIRFHAVEDTLIPIKNQKLYSQWLYDVAKTENKSIDYINYIFCSDDFLKDINVKYLNHDYYTDIITFPYNEGNNIQSDIYISVDRVSENSKDYGIDFQTEMQRVMVHGLLHLVGYNDISDEEIHEMRAKENLYISIFPNP